MSRKSSHIYTPSEYEMKMFNAMNNKYASAREKEFFEKMLHKIQTEYASLNDPLVSCDENPDGIYLYREIYDDFELGRVCGDISDKALMINGLFGVLTLDLAEVKLFKEHITLWEWLRQTDYKYVHYDNWEG